MADEVVTLVVMMCDLFYFMLSNFVNQEWANYTWTLNLSIVLSTVLSLKRIAQKSPDSSTCIIEASGLNCYTQRRTVTGNPVAQNP